MSTADVIQSTIGVPESIVLTAKDIDEKVEEVFPLASLLLEEELLFAEDTIKYQKNKGTCNPLLVFQSDRPDLKTPDDYHKVLNGGRKKPSDCFRAITEVANKEAKSLQRWFSPCPLRADPPLLQWEDRNVLNIHMQDTSMYTSLHRMADQQRKTGTAVHIHCGSVLDAYCKDEHIGRSARDSHHHPLLLLQASLRECDAETLPVPARVVFIAHTMSDDKKRKEGKAAKSPCTVVSNWDQPNEKGILITPNKRQSFDEPLCTTARACDIAWCNRLLLVPFDKIRHQIRELPTESKDSATDFVRVDLGEIAKNGYTKENFLAWMVAQYFPYIAEQSARMLGAAIESRKQSGAAMQTFELLMTSEEKCETLVSRQALLDVLAALEKKSYRGRVMDTKQGFGLDVRIAGGQDRATDILHQMKELKAAEARDEFDDKASEIVRLSFQLSLEFLCFYKPERIPESFFHNPSPHLEGNAHQKKKLPPLGRIADLEHSERPARLITADEYKKLHGSY